MKTIIFNKSKLVMVILLIIAGIYAQAQNRVITKNELPKTAQSFINSNFNDLITSAILEEKEYFFKEYKVLFTNGMEIEFDGDGDWEEVDGNKQAIATSFIPSKILNYMNKSFPNTYITKIEKGRWKYEVKLSNGLDVEFNSNGNFKRIDD